MSTQANQERFAAKLLFQFRVEQRGISNKRRICECRTVLFHALSPRKALQLATKRGRDSQHSYQNEEGATVYFEFVGVEELLHLGIECDTDEVWYDMFEMLEPMERSKLLIPSPEKLRAISRAR